MAVDPTTPRRPQPPETPEAGRTPQAVSALLVAVASEARQYHPPHAAIAAQSEAPLSRLREPPTRFLAPGPASDVQAHPADARLAKQPRAGELAPDTQYVTEGRRAVAPGERARRATAPVLVRKRV
jgi:hypothetical protein